MRAFYLCVPSMIDSLEVEVLFQPDGVEALAKRKGVVARWSLKKAWSKAVASMEKNRITRPNRLDERATNREVRSHQRSGW